MAQTHYEITYIIKPDISEEDKKALVERFDKIIKDNNAEVVDSKDWQKRRLAYGINGYNEGTYHIINVQAADQTAVNEFDRLSKIDDSVLRHMIIKRED
ncbi:30S ribosomal protein S6 [Bombilactobacillus folatiphilus]|uniref:Small ribosomal subunit protein bS6 n=1 Tax=Bombilactobacillus folatiphilus TaxID=2923362 RepID=A0ABY4P958_9LACO|nr:30S ribosomal protein S6 [Bombilactobacillus folatiphilus]UQS82124.1 30S ribosomal protein S6 [Bombilactobacillus folatiphilus]